MNAAAKLALQGAVNIDDYPVDLAWAPDSRSLAVAGGEGRLHLVSVADPPQSRELGEHAPGLLAVAWQPGGTWLATSGQDGGVRLWDASLETPSAEVVHRGTRWPAGLAWRADGKRLAFSSGKSLHVLDESGKPARAALEHPVTLSHVAWRGRDELVAVGNGALFMDRADSGEIAQYVLEGAPVTLVISPDNKIAADGLADGTLNFRNLNTQKRSRMSGYEGKVSQTAWSANSRLLATSSTGATSIVVWDFGGKGPEGTEPLQLEGHEERIESLAWQSSGAHLVSAGRDWRVVLWRPGGSQRKPLEVQLLQGPAAIARWSGDGRRLAVAQTDGRIALYSFRA